MSLPEGVTTFDLRFGPYTDAIGAPAHVGLQGRVTPSSRVLHAGTGQVIVRAHVDFTIGSNGTATVEGLAHSGQSSLNPVDFTYTVDWPTATIDTLTPEAKTVAVGLSDGADQDYDLLPAVPPGADGVTPVLPAVVSVNGHTGRVVLGAGDVGAQPAGSYATSQQLTAGLADKLDVDDVDPAIRTRVATDLADGTSAIGLAGRAAFVPLWTSAEVVAASVFRLAPDGTIIQRNSSGTTRSSYDATEAALWTVKSAAGGGGGTSYTDEQARDAVGTALRGSGGLVITVDDAGDIITVGLPPSAISGRLRGAWAASTAYQANDLVIASGALYAANATFTSASSFNSSDWTVVSLNVGTPGGARRSAIAIGSDLSTAKTTFNDVLQRSPILLPITTTRWRLRICNRSLASAYTGAVALTDVYVGTPAFTASGTWAGAFTAAPALALTGLVMPSDGSDYVTPWVTDTALQFTADTMRALSYGFTCATGQSIGFGALDTALIYLAAGSAAQVAAAAPTGSTGVGAFLDVRLEVEYVGNNRTLLIISDSTGAGATDDPALYAAVPSVQHQWPTAAAYRNRALCLNASIAGSTYSPFLSLAGPALTRFDMATYPPDDAILGSGINSAVANTALAAWQGNVATVVANARTLGAKRVFLTTIIPQPQFKPGALRAAAASGVTSLTTNWAFANGDIVDVDFGKSTYEQLTVSGASVANGDGSYATTFTAATAKAHVINATITLRAESRRQEYNAWVRTAPLGVNGVFDIEPLLRDPAGPTTGSPDLALWGTGTIHPGRGAYSRIAQSVDLRGTAA